MQANNGLANMFMENNPWLATPAPGSDLEFGEFYAEDDPEFAGYPKKYCKCTSDSRPVACDFLAPFFAQLLDCDADDTLPMDEHPYYKDLDYPTPTKDINRLRHDLFDWGFCLIEDAMTPEQTERFRVRVEEQAAGERASGTAYTSGSFQIVVSSHGNAAAHVYKYVCIVVF